MVAILSLSVPAIWWQHLRKSWKDDQRDVKVAELEKAVQELDILVERLCKAASLERTIQ